jgi:hypothetical protein
MPDLLLLCCLDLVLRSWSVGFRALSTEACRC